MNGDAVRGPLWVIASAILMVAVTVGHDELTRFGQFAFGFAGCSFLVYGLAIEIIYTWRKR